MLFGNDESSAVLQRKTGRATFSGRTTAMRAGYPWRDLPRSNDTTGGKSMKLKIITGALALVLLASLPAWAGNIDDVTFLRRIEVYVTVVDTTLVTQEGNRIQVGRGTRLNVAGFTSSEAFVISRKDRPNAFVRRTDIAPANR